MKQLSFCLISGLLRIVSASGTRTFSVALGYSTKVYNVSAASTTISYSYTNEELGLLWDQVGSIAIGPITTTVSPTPEPTVFPRPGIFHPPVPAYEPTLNASKLPPDFQWGVSSASYQIEGAAKDEGRGPSIWDMLVHRNYGSVIDNTTADVAAQHYYLYKQDFARLAALGIPWFSMSISWSRIFPFGKAGSPVNEQGVAHYDDVFTSLMDYNLKVSVTLFHWDTPLALFNSYGAWTSEEIVEDFVNYAIFIITRYDDYVPVWYTFNEPQYCNWQYSGWPAGNHKGLYPAYNNVTGGLPARFLCGHYLLLAHGRVAKWYHEVFKGKGQISLKNSGTYYRPNSTSAADQEAVDRQYQFGLGWFGGPWTDGDYPQVMKDTLGDLLPKFNQSEKEMIKGSCDFYAIDPYVGYYAVALPEGAAACAANSSNPNYPECSQTLFTDPGGFPIGVATNPYASWLWSTPVAIRYFLSDITKKLFPTVPNIVVTEFGFEEPFEGELTNLGNILWDLRRVDYFQSYLDNILAARVEDGVNVTGAFAWAIYDNFEWFSGMKTKFGLQYLNTTSLERIPKASMFQFLDWFKLHQS